MSEQPASIQSHSSIRGRIVRGNLSVVFLLLIAVGIMIWQIYRLTTAVEILHAARQQASAAFEVRQDSTALIAAVSRLLPVEDVAAFENQVGAAVDRLRASEANLAAAASLNVRDREATALLQQVSGRMNGIVGIGDTMVRQVRNGQWGSARVRMGVLIRDQQQLASETEMLVERTQEAEEWALRQVDSAKQAALLYPTIVAIVAIVAGLAVTRNTSRSIARPIEQLTAGAVRIASGAPNERVVFVKRPSMQVNELVQLANAFNQMTEKLQISYTELEKRVNERTSDLERRARQLQAAAEVARDATTELNLQTLMDRTVHLIHEQFGYYHVGIFLLDEYGEWAELRAASSAGGMHMLLREHRLRVGESGIVGYVTATGKLRIALDVGTDAVYFDNPDLPQTRSEIALPMHVRGQIIGALDVQSTRESAFSHEDATVLQILADQVGVGISNARLFQQAQENVEAMQRAYGSFSHQAWQRMTRGMATSGFRYEGRDVQAVPDIWTSGMEYALRSGRRVHARTHPGELAFPVQVRGQIVGVIDISKPEDEPSWTEEELDLFDALVEELEQALDSATLYEETQRRATQEQLVAEATARMRQTLDVNTVLQTATDEIAHVLGLAAVDIRLQMGRKP